MNYYAPLVLQNSSTEVVMFQTIFIAVCNVVGSFIGMILVSTAMAVYRL